MPGASAPFDDSASGGMQGGAELAGHDAAQGLTISAGLSFTIPAPCTEIENKSTAATFSSSTAPGEPQPTSPETIALQEPCVAPATIRALPHSRAACTYHRR